MPEVLKNKPHISYFVLAHFHPRKTMCQYPFYNIDYSGNYRLFQSEKIQWIKIKKYLHGITLKIIYPQLKTTPLAGVSTVAFSHHFDYKNELRRSEGAASLSVYGTFRWTLSKNNFFGIPRKLIGAY